MKYVFDIEGIDNAYIVKVSMEDARMAVRSAQVSFEMNTSNHSDNNVANRSIEDILAELLSNVRLTIHERDSAEQNAEAFIKYLKMSIHE